MRGMVFVKIFRKSFSKDDMEMEVEEKDVLLIA